MMEHFLVFIIILLCATPAHATRVQLSQAEAARVKAFKAFVQEVDSTPLAQTIEELEKTGHSEVNLLIKEAMAKTYVDIVQEVKVEGPSKKKWLYSMVALNMAYLQFGGTKETPGKTEPLNKLIRSKLKKYLPLGIASRPGFHFSVE